MYLQYNCNGDFIVNKIKFNHCMLGARLSVNGNKYRAIVNDTKAHTKNLFLNLIFLNRSKRTLLYYSFRYRIIFCYCKHTEKYVVQFTIERRSRLQRSEI